jgi:virulence-associated protein VapD
MKNRNFVLLSIIVGVLLFLFLIQYIFLKKEGFISRKNKDDIRTILNTQGFSYSDKIAKIKNISQLKDDAINDIIYKNEESLLQIIIEYKSSKYSKLSKKNDEKIQKILNRNISFSKKISNIKNLKINDKSLNDLIFNNEKITVQLITDYMKTNIPEEPKL